MPLASAASTMAAATGCSLPRSKLAASDHDAIFGFPREGRNGSQLRPSLGKRAGLVQSDGVNFLKGLERFSVLDQDAGARTPTCAHHDCHGRCKAKCTGQAMIRTATALTIALASRGAGPQTSQTTNVITATASTATISPLVNDVRGIAVPSPTRSFAYVVSFET